MSEIVDDTQVCFGCGHVFQPHEESWIGPDGLVYCVKCKRAAPEPDWQKYDRDAQRAPEVEEGEVQEQKHKRSVIQACDDFFDEKIPELKGHQGKERREIWFKKFGMSRRQRGKEAEIDDTGIYKNFNPFNKKKHEAMIMRKEITEEQKQKKAAYMKAYMARRKLKLAAGNPGPETKSLADLGKPTRRRPAWGKRTAKIQGINDGARAHPVVTIEDVLAATLTLRRLAPAEQRAVLVLAGMKKL